MTNGKMDRNRWLGIFLLGVLLVLAALSCLYFRYDFQAVNGLWRRRHMLAYVSPMVVAFVLNLFRPRFGDKWRTLTRMLFVLLAIALATDVFQRMAWDDPRVADLSIEPQFVLINLSITAILFTAVWAVVWNARTAAILTFWLMYLLGYAYSCVYTLRGTVFQLSDLTIANTAFAVIANYQLPLRPRYVFWAMVGIALMVPASWVPRQKSRSRRAKVGKLACMALAACWLLILLTTPLLYRMGVVTTTFQAEAIYYNARQGALSTLMKEAWELGKNKPESYSVELVGQTDDRLLHTGFMNAHGNRPNVIVVMNESLTDYSSLYQIPLNEDAMPFIHSLQGQTVYGNLYSSGYGGQTSNMEHGFLTATIPIPNRLTYLIKNTDETTPSLAWQLKAQGYRTFAVHPENKNNYQRSMFYPMLGLDTFLHRDFFADAKRVHGYVSDQACYEQIVRLLEEKPADERYFIFNVTMQNHGGYEQGEVEERIRLPEGIEHPQLVEYLNCVRHTDDAFSWLCGYLEQMDEPTLLLMFGDHQPALTMTGFAKQGSLSPAAQRFTQYITPFVIWANYPIEPEYVEAISVNYLAALLMEKGGMPMTQYDQWLLETMDQYPVVFLHGYADATLQGYQWDAKEENWPGKLIQLNHLRYNRLFDDKNRLPALRRVEASE